MKPSRSWAWYLVASLLTLLSLGFPAAAADQEGGRSRGQLIYVPFYSHIYYGDYEHKMLLTGTLSLRNTDPWHGISITRVDYYDSDGKLIRKYLTVPRTLGPLASTRFIVKESDTKGGSGASFLVEWQAATEVNEPLVEGVMIGATTQQGISFTTRGKVIQRK